MLFFISGICFFLGLSLCLFKVPSSLAACLILLSGALVSLVGLSASSWFSYVLFLVYVGGLLVMFIYVCLVSSNFPFKVSSEVAGGVLAFSTVLLWSTSSPSFKCSLGVSTWSSGSDLLEDSSLSVFLFLAVLLLVMLLIVVRSTGVGNLKING